MILTWLKTFGRTHAFYLILIAVGVFAFRTWSVEHDARMIAEAENKPLQEQVKALQAHQTATDAAAGKQVQVITKVVHDAQTPAQVIQAIPTLTDVPLNARIIPNDPVNVEVAAIPLMQLVGELKTSQVQLGACRSDLADEKKIAGDQTQIITNLKKKPAFWGRVKGTLKTVGVGIGIGIVLAHYL